MGFCGLCVCSSRQSNRGLCKLKEGRVCIFFYVIDHCLPVHIGLGQLWVWLNAGKDVCPWVVGGIAENFSLEERVDQVGLGRAGAV